MADRFTLLVRISIPSNFGVLSRRIYNEMATIDYRICIADQRTPLVVFFGPSAAGKMMAIKRLSLYLETFGCHIVPDFLLIPPEDKQYERRCANFMEFVHSEKYINFGAQPRILLAKVLNHRGMPICQLLKLPGDSCFDIDFVNEDYPQYFNYIINSPNKKIWVFFLDDYTMMYRNAFTSRALRLMKMISHHDEMVFLRSKVDTRREYYNQSGVTNMSLIANEIYGNYPALTDFAYHFLKSKTSWMIKFFPRKCDLVAFSAGSFHITPEHSEIYTQGVDLYPEQLWRVIKKNLKYN